MRVSALTIAVVIMAGSALAGQSTIPDYDTARDNYFWNRLYPFGGITIYCNHVFRTMIEHEATGGAHRSLAGEKIDVEHAYSADWIAEANGCPNRNQCELQAYKFAEGDLHNLWPAIGRINSSRSDLPFAEIPGEGSRRFTGICPDYERTSGSGAVVEPQERAKGNLARSILYMMISYELPTEISVGLLVQWHFADLPDDEERRRNNLIETLQGTRNPFIDYPAVLRLVGQ